MTVDLGLFTAAELRAGGINRRGFLQPLLPPPEGPNQGAADREAANGLASRGLLRREQSGWRPVGRYERVLAAAAVARSLVAVWPADPRTTGFATPRLALGCLGITDRVLDLCPEPAGYHARLMDTTAAGAELADYVATLAATTRASLVTGAGRVGDGPGLAVSDRDPGWAEVAGRLRRGVATVRIEAATITRPTGPLLQHRLTAVATEDGAWLLVGTREGEKAARLAVPAAAVHLSPVLMDLLSGRAIAL
jgi:hypothetical protein